jgi:hypothetical protein
LPPANRYFHYLQTRISWSKHPLAIQIFSAVSLLLVGFADIVWWEATKSKRAYWQFRQSLHPAIPQQIFQVRK